MTLQTEFQKKRQKRRNDIYADYCRLVADPANSKTAIIDYLKSKYNIGAASTIYDIIKEKEGNNENN